MPICTHCTHPVPSLYTVYESVHNLRLEQCPSCKKFADPYVEHDALTLFIDLILLKRDVYRHLLFNRGLGARRLVGKERLEDADKAARELEAARRKWQQGRWRLIMKLGLSLVIVDAFIRWSYLRSQRSSADKDTLSEEASSAFVRVFVGCIAETLAFHIGITLASFVVLSSISAARKAIHSDPLTSGSAPEFHYAQIPLTLLYSSLPKLFLLALLSIWKPVKLETSNASSAASSQHTGTALLISYAVTELTLQPFVNVLDDNVLDREWVVRNLLGGMAAGFGLRVVLNCHPIFTSMVILVGWAFKTTASALLSGWVGGDMGRSQAWFAYSIP